jgi:hypothetical protein
MACEADSPVLAHLPTANGYMPQQLTSFNSLQPMLIYRSGGTG